MVSPSTFDLLILVIENTKAVDSLDFNDVGLRIPRINIS